MEVDWSVILAVVGGVLWMERRFNRIENLLKGCPHVDEGTSQVVGRKTGV